MWAGLFCLSIGVPFLVVAAFFAPMPEAVAYWIFGAIGTLFGLACIHISTYDHNP